MLHVPDNWIGPVRNVHRAIIPKLEIGRPEVAIIGSEKIVRLRTPNLAIRILQRILLDTQETDTVENDEIPVTLLREVHAGDNSTRRHRAHRFFEKLVHLEFPVAARPYLVRLPPCRARRCERRRRQSRRRRQ